MGTVDYMIVPSLVEPEFLEELLEILGQPRWVELNFRHPKLKQSISEILKEELRGEGGLKECSVKAKLESKTLMELYKENYEAGETENRGKLKEKLKGEEVSSRAEKFGIGNVHWFKQEEELYYSLDFNGRTFGGKINSDLLCPSKINQKRAMDSLCDVIELLDKYEVGNELKVV